VVYGNIGRSEILDHVVALKQLTEQRPYLDDSRVGIFGYSFGGYFTLRAMLLAPEVYHVGIAGAPPFALSFEEYHEPYMGLPQKNREGYEYSSNIRLADRLKGKLLFVHGTSDINVPFYHTMKMVDALIQAGKHYDLIVLPGQPHPISGASGSYLLEAYCRYFQEHLKPEMEK
jgi:dipeptidyl aminopeptidase/acylaminoacyl peptidase